MHNGFSQGSLEQRLKYCRFAAREDVTSLQRPLKQSFAIRRATVADCAAILECLLTAFAPYRESYTPEAFSDTVLTPETFRHRLSDMSVVVATSTRRSRWHRRLQGSEERRRTPSRYGGQPRMTRIGLEHFSP